MKIRILPAALALILMAGAAHVHAAEPAPITLTPEVQSLLTQLLQALAKSQPAMEATSSPEPEEFIAEAAMKAEENPEGKAAAAAAKKPAIASSLRTGHLTTGSLQGSAALGGSGAGLSSRLSMEDWRAMFPLK